MLQILHNKLKGVFASTILFLIILSFAAVGLNELFFSRNSHVAAKVDGHPIDWQTVMMFAERMERERGIPVAHQSLEEIRNALVQYQALTNGLEGAGFHISQAQVAKVLSTIRNFQDEKGKFSKNKYLAVLKNYAYQDKAFRQELAQNLLQGQMEQGILLSNFSLPYEYNQALQLLLERRDIGYAVLSKKAFAAKVKILPDALQTFYDSHKTRYVLPEQVVLQYVELRLNQVADQIKVSNAELKNFYLENQEFYNTPEMRHPRHIFFSTEGLDPSAQAAQLLRAEKVLADLKAGKRFEDLVKQSEDLDTQERSGDMGWVGKGDLDVAFEEALFALQSPNELSGIIKSAEGYHIIQLLERKPEMIQPFEAVKETVNTQYRRQKAQQLFEEKKEQLATLTFESADSLDSAKQVMNLKIFETAPFDREGRGAEKWAQYPEFLKAAFSPMVVMEKRNSEVINITPERALVVRLKTYAPARQQAFEEIADQVKMDYIQAESTQSLKVAADKVKEAIQSGERPELALRPYQVTWKEKTALSRRDQSIDRWILEKAFMLGRAPLLVNPEKPVVGAFLLPSGDYGILAVNKVTLGNPRDVDAKMIKTTEKNIVDFWTRMEFALWAQALTSKASIQLMPIPPALQPGPE
jgi:peptidyl-prolyl cis-trans isomerase D